jgi:hypothetical protein
MPQGTYQLVFTEGCDVAAAVATNAGALGIMAHARMYASMPPTNPPGTMDSATQISLTIVGSTSRYSAMPPQTPEIFLSLTESVNCLCDVLEYRRAPQEEQKLASSAISALHRLQYIMSPPEVDDSDFSNRSEPEIHTIF